MNTEVNYEIAKLLKEKGFNEPTLKWYHRETKKLNTNDLMFSMNKLTDNYSAPTIAEVIMWLYEKHKIWISVLRHKNDTEKGFVAYNNDKVIDDKIFFKLHSSPTEAYLSAINYYLKDLV
jgi:hypothetical protein